jgi:hypothetical protein
LAKDKVVRAKGLAKRSSLDGVHCPGLEVNEDRPGDVSALSDLVEVHVDLLFGIEERASKYTSRLFENLIESLILDVSAIAGHKSPDGIESVLVRDDFPELAHSSRC